MDQHLVSKIIMGFAAAVAAALMFMTITIVRRSSAAPERTATKEGVLFVVSTRRWQRVILRTAGVVMLLLAVLSVAGSLFGTRTNPAMGLIGVLASVVGIGFLLLARGMRRRRLEVTPASIWVFPMFAAPREVSLAELTALGIHFGNNFGGVVGRSKSRKRFAADRLMLGYPQLIEFLRERRPDLAVPPSAIPFQETGRDTR